MAAAAGKKEHGLPFLVHGGIWLGSGGRALHRGYSVLGRRSLDWKWSHEQKEAWMRQIREVQTWKQVRGLAGAVMCETRDLGIKWPYWHTLLFSSEITIDMRFVCPKDVRKMLVQRTRSVYWMKWAAKHE